MVGLLAILAAGCAGTRPAAPVEERQQPPPRSLRLHIVDREETLYSIAFRYEISLPDLARINRIASPYVIYPGQRLYLTPEAAIAAGINPGAPVAAGTVSAPPVASQVTVVSQPTRATATSQRVADVVLPARIGQWHWPIAGRLTRAFGSGQPAAKGISIAAEEGASVTAAAPGVVVYSGSGLRGYGNLLIVKHSETFLSAYAHNAELLVGEGDEVRPGQSIARVGRSPEGRPELYFEIREDGSPVDPVRFLPPR